MPRPKHSPLSQTPLTEPSTFSDDLPLPKLFVFDLDYTLWPFWVDTHVTSPLKPVDGGAKVKDRYGEGFGFYGEVGCVLVGLKKRNIPIAAASRTEAPELAREMLKLLRLPLSSPDAPSDTSPSTTALSLFTHLQIYPGSKIRHFEALHAATGISYEDMLFFDDEARNRETERLGVTMWLVRDGVSMGEVDEGVRCWRKRNNKSR